MELKPSNATYRTVTPAATGRDQESNALGDSLTEQHEQFNFRRFISATTAIPCAVMSCHWTMQGSLAAQEIVGDPGFREVADAVLVGILSTFLISTAVWFLTAVYPDLTDGKLIRQARFAILGYVIFALSTSGFYNVLGFTGDSSRVLAWQEGAAIAEQAADAAERQALMARPYLPIVSGAADGLCKLATQERKGGVSGTGAGDGPVWAAHQRACAQATTAVDALTGALSRSGQRSAEIRSELDALNKGIGDRSLSMRQREDAYRRHAGRLRDLIREANSEGVATSVSTSFEALSAATVADDGKNSKFDPRQSESLRMLQRSVQGIAGVMAKLGKKLTDAAPPTVEIPEPPSATSAALRYAGQHIPQIALAIGVDVAFLFFLTILQLNRAQIAVNIRAAKKGKNK